MSGVHELIIENSLIRYQDDILLASHIARLYIVKFRNRDYEKAEGRYHKEKVMYMAYRNEQRRSRLWLSIVGMVLFGIVGVVALCTSGPLGAQLSAMQLVGLICLGAGVLCLLSTILAIKMGTAYPIAPPDESDYPDRHGLFLEMDSGRAVVFTAWDDIGRKSLRTLQQTIVNAISQQTSVVFNMTENHISVEQNDGIISTGDIAENTVYQEKL